MTVVLVGTGVIKGVNVGEVVGVADGVKVGVAPLSVRTNSLLL